MLLYCGNLERYQGIDLLLDSFSLACKKTNEVDLIIVGGEPKDIERYREKANILGIAKNTHFLGPQPFDRLNEFLVEADILVAPRIKGINTPMKIFHTCIRSNRSC
ncbi:MAG: glycosyltransferase [Nitrospinales bacterium]